jgi:hypothetical protein
MSNSHRWWPVTSVAYCLLLAACGSAQKPSAYFKMENGIESESFIFQLDDPTKIAEARAIISGTQQSQIVWGDIRDGAANYNPRWHFQLDPVSIRFVQTAPQLCNLAPSIVEQRLQSGAPLPPDWCPWGHKVVSEVRSQVDR